MKTIVAIFDDISLARQVVEDLVKADFARNSIRLITNDAQNQYSHFLEKDYKPRIEAVTALEGAGLGLIVGALTGILLSITAFLIPSLGLALNPLVSAALGAIIGTLLGAFIGAVIRIAVSEDDSRYYAEAIKRGATLISIHTNNAREAKEVMHYYGTIDLAKRVGQWRQAGWSGFETLAQGEEGDTKPWAIPNTLTQERTIFRDTSMPPKLSVEKTPISILEPETDEEDTKKSIPLVVRDGKTASFSLIPEPEFSFNDIEQDSVAACVIEAQEHSAQD